MQVPTSAFFRLGSPLAVLGLVGLGCPRVSPDDVPADDTTDSRDTDTGTSAPLAPYAHHAVIVVMDGARVDETFGTPELDALGGYSDAAEANTADLVPAMRASLLPYGTLIRPGYCTGITITGPGHATLLSGVRQGFGHFATPDGAGMYRTELPTLFEAIGQQLAPEHDELVLMGNTDHIESLNYSLYPGAGAAFGAQYALVTGDDGSPSESDPPVADAVLATLEAQHPKLLLVNLHGMDRAGHYNNDPLAYAKKVEDMDRPIADLWTWIQSDQSGGMKDDTVLVVISDHGRHRWGAEAETRLEGQPESQQPDYRNHGDQCRGCREIPMFLIGPGIKQGATILTPHTQEDVGRTVARILGVELPYSTGLVMNDIFDAPPTEPQRQGKVWPDATDTLTVWEQYTDDYAAQSLIVVDGETLSTPGAIHAEQPSIYSDGDRDTVCWRELSLLIDTSEVDWPWLAQCRTRLRSGQAAGVWDDMRFPLPSVSTLWKPEMVTDTAGRVLFAYADNEYSSTYWNTVNPAQVKLLRWSEGAGWEGMDDSAGQTLFPGNPSVASSTAADGSVYVAYAGSDLGEGESTSPGRYSRHINVSRVNWETTQGWSQVYRNTNAACPVAADCPWDASEVSLDTDGVAWGRMESPAIMVDAGGSVTVGFLAYNEDDNAILTITSDDQGVNWSPMERIDTSGRVLGHLPPRWIDGALYWARLTGGATVEACRWTAGGTADCLDTGRSGIMGFSRDGSGGVQASLDSAAGDWVLEPVIW